MSEYDNVKLGKLVLKGDRSFKRKRVKNTNKREKFPSNIIDTDAIKHGGWWRVTKIDEIVGTVAIEFRDGMYLRALNNGLFALGAPHDVGEGPFPEEIFTAFTINENKIVIKSGYGKYMKVEDDGIVTGRSEAVGFREQWRPVFQKDKVAILGENDCSMSIDPESSSCVAVSKKVTEAEFVIIRSCAAREIITEEQPLEEKGNLAEVEINFVKKFQKFQNKKIAINTSGIKELKIAKGGGNLHEKLLDRRSKMKADRYCK